MVQYQDTKQWLISIWKVAEGHQAIPSSFKASLSDRYLSLSFIPRAPNGRNLWSRSNAICVKGGWTQTLNSTLTLSSAINPRAGKSNFPQIFYRQKSSTKRSRSKPFKRATITQSWPPHLWTFFGGKPLNNGLHITETALPAEEGFGLRIPQSTHSGNPPPHVSGPAVWIHKEAPSNGFLMGSRRKTDGLTEGMLNISCSNCYIGALTFSKTRA